MLRLIITIVLSIFCLKSIAGSPVIKAEKILLITVSETGLITVGRDMVSSDDLARYIQERLFKSYMGTGLMHNKITLVKEVPHTPDLVIEVVMKEIKAGQKRALTELCLQKHKKLFDHLSTKQQEKLKKQFPVLFHEPIITDNVTR